MSAVCMEDGEGLSMQDDPYEMVPGDDGDDTEDEVTDLP